MRAFGNYLNRVILTVSGGMHMADMSADGREGMWQVARGTIIHEMDNPGARAWWDEVRPLQVTAPFATKLVSEALGISGT